MNNAAMDVLLAATPTVTHWTNKSAVTGEPEWLSKTALAVLDISLIGCMDRSILRQELIGHHAKQIDILGRSRRKDRAFGRCEK